jgi:hypothetical protein
MQLAKNGLFLRLAARSCLLRSFAKKKIAKQVKLVERDEYDLETALKLLKASAVSPIDESIDILIK